MKTMNRVITGAAAAALTAGISLAAPLVASADSPDINACHLDRKVDELRGWDPNGTHNIMVWRDRARGPGTHFENIKSEDKTQAQPCKEAFASHAWYHWVVFEGGGTFQLKGDGGYRNWAFYGNFKQDGRVVTFFPGR